MTFERRIASTVFAVGVLLAVNALAGCGGGQETQPPATGADPAQPEPSSSLAVDRRGSLGCNDLERDTPKEVLEACIERGPDLEAGTPLCKESHAPVRIDGVTILPEKNVVRVDWADSSSVSGCRIEVTDMSDKNSASSNGIAVRMRVGSLGSPSTLDLRPRCSYAKVEFDLTPDTEVLLSSDGVDQADRAPEPGSETTEGCDRISTAAVKGYIPPMLGLDR